MTYTARVWNITSDSRLRAPQIALTYSSNFDSACRDASSPLLLVLASRTHTDTDVFEVQLAAFTYASLLAGRLLDVASLSQTGLILTYRSSSVSNPSTRRPVHLAKEIRQQPEGRLLCATATELQQVSPKHFHILKPTQDILWLANACQGVYLGGKAWGKWPSAQSLACQ